jgi:GT2 family glycosyltransferase
VSLPLSIVVPTRDRVERLERCLEAIGATLRSDDELIVVDSASTDPRVGAVAEAAGARVVRCERPGVSRARNAGAAAAHHGVLAFVDDDVRVRDGWADAIAAPFTDDGIAFVTGRVEAPPDQRDRQRLTGVTEVAEGRTLDERTPSPLGSTANIAVRRPALDRIGGFDEALGGGARFCAAEDLDLFDRLLAAGFTGRYEPAAAAWHDQWRSRRQQVVVDWRYGVGAGARLAKLVRTNRARARMAAGESAWDDGLRLVGRAVRVRQEFFLATTLARVGGMVAGMLAGLVAPLRAGRFAGGRR